MLISYNSVRINIRLYIINDSQYNQQINLILHDPSQMSGELIFNGLICKTTTTYSSHGSVVAGWCRVKVREDPTNRYWKTAMWETYC